MVDWRDAEGRLVCYRCRERGRRPDRTAIGYALHGALRDASATASTADAGDGMIVPMCLEHLRASFDRWLRRRRRDRLAALGAAAVQPPPPSLLHPL